MLPIRTILHPTDFSDCSKHAFQFACSLARTYDARLVLLHVAVPLFADGMTPSPTIVDETSLRELLNELKPADKNIPVDRCVLEGDPANEILNAVRRTRSDLIVMGTHGRTGLSRLLMGSVADQVVRKAPCPVLTLRTPSRPPSSEQQPQAAVGNEVRGV